MQPELKPEDWPRLKEGEQAFARLRKRLESEIAQDPEVIASLKAKPFGKREILGLALSVSAKRVWCQKTLAALVKEIPLDDFPFTLQFVEDKEAAKRLEDDKPEVWKQIQDAALSIKQNAPTFGPAKGKKSE